MTQEVENIAPQTSAESDARVNGNQTTDLDRTKIIKNTKESVDRLMIYAVKTPEIEITTEFLNEIIPVLRKESASFSVQDEVILWSSYKQLTQLVKPATDCSIAIASQLNARTSRDSTANSGLDFFKFWKKNLASSDAVKKSLMEIWLVVFCLIVSIVFYIIIQSYCAALSKALANVHSAANEWHTQQKLITDLQLVYAQTNGDDGKAKLEDLKFNMTLLNNRFAASLRIIILLNQPVILFIENTSFSEIQFTQKSCSDVMQNAQDAVYLTKCNVFQDTYASLLYILIAQYLLPLVLGVVGATSYIVRDTLAKLENNSFLPCARGKIIMRICLGGLLGVIGGIFIQDDSTQLEDFNLSLVMLSLVMGYSVEVAFSLFDQVVDRMKDWTTSLKTNSKADK